MLLVVEPTDVTIKILQEIRDDNRAMRSDMNARFDQMDRRFEQVDQRLELMDKRFVVVESTLKDLAEQMVMLARAPVRACSSRSSTR